MKKILKNIIVCCIILSMFTICFATNPGEEGDTRDPGNQGQEGWAKDEQRFVHTQPYKGGTDYGMTYTDEEGNTQSLDIKIDAGSSTGEGGMQGYDSDSMKNGKVTITKEDIIKTLQNVGTAEALAAAKAIEAGGEYRMLAQQYIYVRDKLTGQVSAMTMDEIAALSEKAAWGFGNAKYDLWTPYNNYKDLWYDADDSDPTHGVFYWKPTPTSTPAPIEEEDPTSPNPPTPEPTPEPEPEVGFALVKSGLKDCYSNNVSTFAKIDNSQFKVYDPDPNKPNGNPIPTSEELRLSGDTNWIANVGGIEEWGVKILSISGFKARSSYYTGRVEIFEYEKDENGNWEYVKTSYINSDEQVPTSTSEKRYRKGSPETKTTGYREVDLERKYKDQIVMPYTYIGNAYVETTSTVEINNAAVGGTKFASLENDEGKDLQLDISNCQMPPNVPSRVNIKYETTLRNI